MDPDPLPGNLEHQQDYQHGGHGEQGREADLSAPFARSCACGALQVAFFWESRHEDDGDRQPARAQGLA